MSIAMEIDVPGKMPFPPKPADAMKKKKKGAPVKSGKPSSKMPADKSKMAKGPKLPPFMNPSF